MHVYYIKNFKGHYPVGTSAIIVAQDRTQAFQLLAAQLKEHGLIFDWKDVNPTDFKQLDIHNPRAIVLQDGDY